MNDGTKLISEKDKRFDEVIKATQSTSFRFDFCIQ